MDEGFKQSEKMLKELEAKIHAEYSQAAKEVAKEYNVYFARFRAEDEEQHQLYVDGVITKSEYAEWRKRKMLTGKRYRDLKDTLAKDLTNTDKIAMSYVRDNMIDVYALNMNYGTYSIEHDSKIDTSFSLYNRDAVQRLIKDNPEVLPMPSVDVPKDMLWNRQHINSAITQGILQGKTIPQVAKNLQNVTGMDERAAIRNARTGMTSAQNGGRYDSMKRAAARGIGLKKGWMATLDHVTRDSHVDLDGEVQELDRPFSNGLMYPADASGRPEEVYNCRCRLTHEYDKYKTDWSRPENRNTAKLGSMSYDEWKNKHKAKEKKTTEETNRPKRDLANRKIRPHREIRQDTNTKVTSMEDAIISAKTTFENIDTKVSQLDEELFIKNINQFNELNAKFKGVNLLDQSGLILKNGRFVAAVQSSYNSDSLNLVLNPKYYGSSKSMLQSIRFDVESNFMMPCVGEKYEVYAITHEYGHIMHEKFIRKRTDFDDIERKSISDRMELELLRRNRTNKAQEIRKEIINIAKEDNENFKLLDNISEYGRKDDYEFFAEVFANSQCGEPNELGKAMVKWLEKEGY